MSDCFLKKIKFPYIFCLSVLLPFINGILLGANRYRKIVAFEITSSYTYYKFQIEYTLQVSAIGIFEKIQQAPLPNFRQQPSIPSSLILIL